MTAFEKYQDTLKLFGIPSGDAGAGEDVRKILARLLAARSLRLAQLQTARDIFERAKEQGKEQDVHLYLFLAAMLSSTSRSSKVPIEQSHSLAPYACRMQFWQPLCVRQ